MYFRFLFIIFCFNWPTISFSKVTAKGVDEIQLDLKNNPKNDLAWFNSSLKNFQESELGKARADIEKSIFLNPLNFESKKLKEKILNKLYELPSWTGREELIPDTYYYFDYVPEMLFILLLVLSLCLLVYAYSKQRFLEKTYFKKNPEWRSKVLIAGVLTLFIGALYLYKIKTQADKWACLVKEAELYSGMGEEYSLSSKLPEGACVKVISSKGDWISLGPEYSSGGWTHKNRVEIVRGF